MEDERTQQHTESITMNSLEIDTIGEILNISMGSAATAISTMLDRQVVISTPTVVMRKFNALDYAALEPAMLVKISYVEGISGSNVMIFRQKDMQIILNLLMGNDDPPSDDFTFDELSMSAACEVMNQMMGASATALSEFLGRPINISTPEVMVVDPDNDYAKAVQVQEGEEIVSVSFRLTIDGVMDSNFASILGIQLAKEIVDQVMGQQGTVEAPAQPAPAAQPAAAPAAAQPAAAAAVQQPAAAAVPQRSAAPAQPAAQPQGAIPQQMPAGYPPYPAYPNQPPYPGYPYYGGYPPYPAYPNQPMPYGAPAAETPVSVQTPQFPQFAPQGAVDPNQNGNMDLLMGVSLNVSVEIGRTKRKIKDIVDFGQGTVIELNKQAGAPVDIVVNGQLLARGDVVVIDDNFGVRITEIVGVKELMESLKEEAL